MQQSSNQGSITNESSVDNHHEVLSVNQKPQQGLMNHLQTGLPNPMDLILEGVVGPQKSLLNHVSVRPATAPVTTPNTTASPLPPASPGHVVIDHDRPLSQCLLWDIMQDYYESLGINAWKAGIPMFITNSAYFAESYAEIIIAFLEDYHAHLDFSEPIYIVELASGTGRFSHLLLKELERKLPCFSMFEDVKIRYVMTDFTDQNPNFWAEHPNFKPFLEKGILDFAVLNPLEANSMQLRVSGQMLSNENIKNPMIGISNYFFDSVQQDAFRVESKVLKEGRITLERQIEGIDPASKVHITQIKTSFNYRELYNTNYYDEPRFNGILNHYRHNIKNGSILFPVGALNVIKNLQTLANDKLVLISSDKGYSCPFDMIRFYHHDFAIHDGTFSYMVNYDAIGHFFKQSGGRMFNTTAKNLSLQTVCCIQMDAPDCKFERLNYVYREKIDRANNINSICSIMPNKSDDNAIAKLTIMLSQIRLNLADPHIFFAYGQGLVDVVGHALHGQREDLLSLMEQAWSNYYFYPGESNLPFWFSQIYYTLGLYEKSVVCLDKALELFGEHEVLHFLKGQNYEKLQQLEQARNEYQTAVNMRADFPEAWDCLTNLDSRLR